MRALNTLFVIAMLLAALGAVLSAGSPRRSVFYDRPLGNCVEMRDLLRNRKYPPRHGVHSYARPVPICKEAP